ncbi:MAG TPA: acyl-CoA dehydrogenase family protein [Verrucomicrobiae bacterium]|nr:acyl-CoA dehydrogenase family protein [Verrucomicrobiae bacterium]
MLDVFDGLGPDERLLGETVRQFAQDVIAPGAIERDEAERFDRSLVDAMGELGLLAGPFPESVGGAGLTAAAWTIVVEEIAAADMAVAISLCVHVLHQNPVVRWGTPEQQARWLPALQAGRALGAFALTEPGAGSDAAALRMRATRLGPDGREIGPDDRTDAGEPVAADAYRLDGTKIWISNAPEAERYLVFATLDPLQGTAGITAFLVEKGTPGFGFGAHEKKMGIRACPAAELVFDGAVIPAANRLGGEGEGYRVALSALGDGRIAIAAACTGLARAALDRATAYLHERRAFGVEIAELQGLRFMVAEMAQQVATARALTRVAAAARDRGAPAADVAVAASLAKWTASDAAMRVTTDAVQLFGGSGYSRETGVERLMRDAKGAQIYEGTNQVHRGIVADAILGRVPG